MSTGINKDFHALCAQMVEETGPEKLQLLKQRLRLLLFTNRADLEKGKREEEIKEPPTRG
jgi:hypothetical protein